MPFRPIRLVAVVSTLAALGACGSDSGTDPGAVTPPTNTARSRTYRMGFSDFPPKLTIESVIATINAWTPRADAAIMHNSVPYQALLGGASATQYVTDNDLDVANLYRTKNLVLAVTVDVTDGLNRSAESPELVALHRSITEPAVQQVYRDYVRAVVSVLHPDYLGLAAETNLIRDEAPAPVYAALVQMTNAAAADVKAAGAATPQLYVSVQADEAWGPPPAPYRGAETDFHDFPFMQVMGISSYPYFFFTNPSQLPLDYYSRLKNGRSIPVMVVEGGWSSASVGPVVSSPDNQANYVRRHAQILDSAKAIAVFQLDFTDFSLASFAPIPPGSIIPLFASIGFVDTLFKAKPALAVYDSVFALPFRR